MAFTTYLRNKVLDDVLGTTAYVAPTTVYAALYTTATNASGGGNEVVGNGYVRKAIAFDAAASGAADNTAAVEFDTATASWGTITHTAILDASTSGNMMMEGALTASKVIGSGDVFRFQAGEFDTSLT